MNKRDLDRHITGNGGEDQYPEKEPEMSDVADASKMWEENELVHDLGYSPALAKACIDSSFDYAMCLIDGTVWRICGARAINKDYVHVGKVDFETCSSTKDYRDEHDKPKYPFERGVDVRVDCIMWIADAPEGS